MAPELACHHNGAAALHAEMSHAAPGSRLWSSGAPPSRKHAMERAGGLQSRAPAPTTQPWGQGRRMQVVKNASALATPLWWLGGGSRGGGSRGGAALKLGLRRFTAASEKSPCAC